MSYFRAIPVSALLLASLAACADAPTSPSRPREPRPVPVPLGLYSFTLTGLDGSSREGVQASVARAVPDGPDQALSHVAGGLAYEVVSSSSVTEGVRGKGGQRFVTVTYRVRNTTGAPLTNLTLIPVTQANTISGTPFFSLSLFNGTAASPALASKFVPSGAVTLGPDGALRSQYADVIQVFTEAEVAAITPPAAVTGIFPYGFVVRNPNTPDSRTLPNAASPNEWSGLLTFSFRYPLQGNAANDPFSINFQAIAIQDTETRMTESIEESQDTAGVRLARARAAALGATTVTVLAGSPALDLGVTDYPGQRLVCSVRTAGPAGGAVTTITSPGAYSRVAVFRPGQTLDPCSAYSTGGTPAFAFYGMPYVVTLRAMDRYGNVHAATADTATLTSSDGTASMPVAAALVGGVATVSPVYVTYGNSTLTATTRRLVARSPVTVWGMTRHWTGDAGTGWLTNGDWSLNMHPGVQDSVTIPGDRPAYPALVQNHTTAGLIMTEGSTVQPTLNLGAYDLTVNGNVNLGPTGTMTGTGRLILAGTAATVGGGVSNFDVRNMRVLGTYTTSSNINVSGGRIVVQGGRLRNYANRVRVRP